MAANDIPDDEGQGTTPPPEFISDAEMAQQSAAPKTAPPDFISDEDMAQQPAQQQAAPDFMSDEDMVKPHVESTGAGALARGGVRGAITTIASLPEIGIGAELGTMVAPGIGTAIGALGGAIVGSAEQVFIPESGAL